MDNLTKSYLGLSAVGTAVAVYHAYDEVTQNFNSCNVNAHVSCGNVFASGYVSILGVPFYVLGLIWFPATLLIGLWLTHDAKKMKGEVLLPVLMIGNVFTIYLWYLELFRIGSICPVCMAMYIINYAMTAVCAAVAMRSS
jgi:uncharacterized membrane protein